MQRVNGYAVLSVWLGKLGWEDTGAPHPTSPPPLPSMSSDTGVRRMSPVNSQVVFWASIPEVPSNTYGTRGYSNKGLAGDNGAFHSMLPWNPALGKTLWENRTFFAFRAYKIVRNFGSVHLFSQHGTDTTYLNYCLGP